MEMCVAGRLSLLLSSALLACACFGSSFPIAPEQQQPGGGSGSPTPTVPQPLEPLVGDTYVFLESRFNVAAVTRASRYVLRSDGQFALQYPTVGADYRGTYTEADGVLTLRLKPDAAPWSAILVGDRLDVRYNELMRHSDFEDATYLLLRQ